MSKFQKKALLGCLGLISAYSSANIDHAAAAAENNAHSDHLTKDSAAEGTALTDSIEMDDATVAINSQEITPDNPGQPVFMNQLVAAPQESVMEESVTEERLVPVTTEDDNRTAKLKHLIATIAHEVPADNEILLQRRSLGIVEGFDSEKTVSRERVSVSTELLSDPIVAQVPTQIEIEAVEVSQVPTQDSSEAVGDSFRPEDLTDNELRQLLSVENPTFSASRVVPASSFGTPTAYGANGGDAFIAVAGITDGDRDSTDGSMSLGVGFGDAVDSVGVELNAGIISLDGFAEDGQVGIKVHKIFPEADMAVAVGWSNPITWGAANDAKDTIYGVVTKRFDLQPDQSHPMPLTISGGVGTGNFRSLGAIAADSNDPNVFGSVGLQVNPDVSVVSSWTGRALNVGVSAAPFDFPLVVTAGAADITDNTTEGPRFSASVGYGFQF